MFYCSTSLPSGNLVDGLPLAFSSGMMVVLVVSVEHFLCSFAFFSALFSAVLLQNLLIFKMWSAIYVEI